ncbi:variable large family protein (plasmid) [Borrelia coriaceae]|uniref:Variable large protein n=1 Tax=Borrelia coriaceae ATCC 43381 TaxID=1408429 RepID=W5T1V1_9SPIR|nr:variable large family protein [Borrelia coriaceae]AHH11256.1 Variable major protein [Borrelia coriaceae ATCC 43381]UPA17436.1 variable large family protein [Borrelia coriaceae]
MKINIKNIKVRSICATLFISLFLSCNSGVIEELEKRNTFFDSLVNIGHGFQEILGSFGNTVGDALGFNAVKSGDPKSAVGKHFEKIKKGLENIKGKLDGLTKDITSTPHADTTGVETVINSASDVLTKLIDSVSKLAGVTNDSDPIGIANSGGAPSAADKAEVDTVIKSVSSIIEVAEESGVKIEPGNAGSEIAKASAQTDAIATFGGHNSGHAQAGAGDKLAVEVSKADPWAIINKIKHAIATVGAKLKTDTTNEAGGLAASNDKADNTAGAKSNADLAAAVALKAMIKGGKFSAASGDEGAVKGAATSAVNKVLGILNLIIRQTVESNLDKLRKAVKEMKYSEAIGTNSTQSGTATK